MGQLVWPWSAGYVAETLAEPYWVPILACSKAAPVSGAAFFLSLGPVNAVLGRSHRGRLGQIAVEKRNICGYNPSVRLGQCKVGPPTGPAPQIVV